MIQGRSHRTLEQVRRVLSVGLLAAVTAFPVFSAEEFAIERSAVYVPVRDGTRLAVDIYRSASARATAPVILTMTPYQRARQNAEGQVVPDATTEFFVRHGYVVAIGDVRGKGASFGARGGPSDQTESNDVGDVIEWLADHPWSNGMIGMQGCSYVGSTVLAGMWSGAPHLKAVAVGSTQFDQMTSFTDGGASRTRVLADEAAGVDADIRSAVPVDEDGDGSMLRSTRADKVENLMVSDLWRSMPFRDSVSPLTNDPYWISASAYSHIDEIGANNIPMYMYGSWYDPFGNETVNAWFNFTNPKWLMMSRGAHCQTPDIDRDAELVRFFDHWLKGIDNGFDAEPKVRYYIEGGQPGHEWQTASQWPLPGKTQSYVLGVNGDQGMLTDSPGKAAQLTVTPPDNILPFLNFSVERSGVDPLSVVFTSQPLSTAELVAGTPVVHLWLSAPAEDYVVKAYLEHVNAFRSPEVIAHGKLLASRRMLGEAPYDTGGIPWPTQREIDAQPLKPGEPVELTFGLSPIARQLRPGDRLRLAVTLRAAPEDPLIPLTVYSGGDHDSWLDVPLAGNSNND